MSNAKPQYGIVGEDEYGRKSYGWIDPGSRSVTPQPTGARPAGESVIPPTPFGVDPKMWRDKHTERVITDALPGSSKEAASLRNEVRELPSYKAFASAAPVYRSMVDAAGRDTRAADVNMIYAMAKIMDPGSVVRESEMTVAQAVATLPQYLKANIESQISAAGRLSPQVREALMQEAYSRIDSYQGLFNQDMDMFRGIAKRGRISEEDVIPNFGQMRRWE